MVFSRGKVNVLDEITQMSTVSEDGILIPVMRIAPVYVSLGTHSDRIPRSRMTDMGVVS